MRKCIKEVTERERWFNIVMGDKFKVEAGATDRCEIVRVSRGVGGGVVFSFAGD